jgi:tetratricopeptide (TPR) repeat protein
VGLVWGLAAISRPNVLILAPIIFWYLYQERRLPWRSRGWLFLAIGLALPILPVTGHNLFKARDAVFIASQGGVNFYIGNNPYSDGRTAYVPGTLPTWQGGYDDVIAMAKKETGREDLKPSGVDRHFLGKGVSFWFQEPGRALMLYLHKLRLLFAMGERSNNKNIYFWRERSKILRWPVWLGWTPVLILAVLGFFRRDLLKSRRFLLLGCCLAYAFSIYLFFINARFRLPILVLLAIAAGGGLDRIWEAWRAKRWLDPRKGLVVAGTVLLFATVPDLIKFTENDLHADPFSWHTLGNGYNAAGQYFQARQAYKTAIAISKEHPQPHFYWIQGSLYTKLADLLIRLQRPEEAVEVYTDYIRDYPSDWEMRLLLGDLLLQTGRADEAAAQFEVVLRNDPDNGSAKLGHAWILLHNGESGAALRRFMELFRQHGSTQALFGAGMCQMDLNQLDEAQKTFEQVLSLQGDYWQALGNLAVIYERTDQRDKAYRAYQELLRINPHDARAQQWLREHTR